MAIKDKRRRIRDLNERIDKRHRELDRQGEHIDRIRKRLKEKRNRAEDVREDFERADKLIEERRERFRDVKAEIEEIEADGIGPEEQEEWDKLSERREILADKIDELAALKKRLIERLQDLAESRKDAKDEIEKLRERNEVDRKVIDKLQRKRKRVRKALEEAIEGRGNLSPHFSIEEFDCNDGTDCPGQSRPALEAWCQAVGEPLHARFGTVHVNSGFRHARYNAEIGGEPNSVHIYNYPGRDYRAVAGDITCERGSPDEWFAFTAGKADGRGRYLTFHHADNRNRIGWPDAVWYG